jgi:uncharacterized protein (DUF1684 family)
VSLSLLDWRRRTAALYADVRATSATDPEGALERFRAGRHDLFTHHPDRPGGPMPVYWPYRADLRFEAVVDTDVEPLALDVARSDGTVVEAFTRFGTVHLPIGDLDVYWLESYGGGVFLPFRDATCGTSSYGGGRYLLDTVKGADLGGEAGALVVDFNYAYHPSCFYSDDWACPLAPPGNRLAGPVEAGERVATD